MANLGGTRFGRTCSRVFWRSKKSIFGPVRAFQSWRGGSTPRIGPPTKTPLRLTSVQSNPCRVHSRFDTSSTVASWISSKSVQQSQFSLLARKVLSGYYCTAGNTITTMKERLAGASTVLALVSGRQGMSASNHAACNYIRAPFIPHPVVSSCIWNF